MAIHPHPSGVICHLAARRSWIGNPPPPLEAQLPSERRPLGAGLGAPPHRLFTFDPRCLYVAFTGGLGCRYFPPLPSARHYGQASSWRCDREGWMTQVDRRTFLRRSAAVTGGLAVADRCKLSLHGPRSVRRFRVS